VLWHPFLPGVREGEGWRSGFEAVEGVDEAAEAAGGEAVVAESDAVELEVILAADLCGQWLSAAEPAVRGDRTELVL
jgi:hypothetical protein